MQGFGIQVVGEITSIHSLLGIRVEKEAVVQPHLAFNRRCGIDPLNRAFDLSSIGRIPASTLGIVGADQLNDLSVLVLDDLFAGHIISVFQSDFFSRGQAKVFLGRVFHEIVLVYEDFSRERHFPCSGFRIFGIVDRIHFLRLSLGVILYHHLEGIEYTQSTDCSFVEVRPQAMLEEFNLDHVFPFGQTYSLREFANGFRGVAPSSHSLQSSHPRVVPTVHVSFIDQAKHFAFAHHDISHVQSGEFNLLRVVNAQVFAKPIIKRTMMLEFKCTKGVGYSFD